MAGLPTLNLHTQVDKNARLMKTKMLQKTSNQDRMKVKELLSYICKY